MSPFLKQLRGLGEIDLQLITFTALTVVLTLLAALVLHRVFIKSLMKFEEMLVESKKRSHRPSQAQRVQTVVGLIRQLGTVLLGLITGVIVLDLIGVDIRPILAGAGVVGLAVGFGAQSLVKDFFTGLCLILENQVTIGDFVKVKGLSGTVETLNFRIMVLRDLEGTVHVIPNGTIDTVSNFTHGWSAMVLDLPVPPEQDYESTAKLFRDIGKELQEDEAWRDLISEELEILGLQDLSERGMVIRIRIKTIPGSQWSLGREFRRRLKDYWDEQGLEIPKTTQNLKLTTTTPAFKSA